MIFIRSYKCRHCGEIFETSKKLREDINFDDTDKIQILPGYNKIDFIQSEYSRASCPITIIHKCKNSGPYGIADLISVDSADDDLYRGEISS